MDNYGFFRLPGNSHLFTPAWGTGPHRDSREGHPIFGALKPPWTLSHLQHIVFVPWHLPFHPLSHISYFGEMQHSCMQLPHLCSCSVQLCPVTGDAATSRERDCHPSRGWMPAGDVTASLPSTPAAYSPRHLQLCTSLPGTGRMGLSEVSLCKVSLAYRKSAQRRQIC